MNRPQRMRRLCCAAFVALTACCTGVAWAQPTAFTYQGKLTDAGSPANGNYDLRFSMFDALSGGTQQGAILDQSPVAASAGVFTVTLDFGNVFSGADRYMEIAIRPAGSAASYTVLAPRQQITSSPYAIQTLNAQFLGGLQASRYVSSAANGNVGIGTATPVNGRLQVEASTGHGVYGKTTSTTASGVYGESPAAIAGTAGVFGKGTGNGGVGVGGEANIGTAIGTYGVSTSPTGFGMYARNLYGGRAIHAEGFATQSHDQGGWVKAMVHVNTDGTIARCFNGETGATTGGCGVSVVANGFVALDVIFPFNINNRYVVVRPYSPSGCNSAPTVGLQVDDQTPNKALVYFACTTSAAQPFVFAPFDMLVY